MRSLLPYLILRCVLCAALLPGSSEGIQELVIGPANSFFGDRSRGESLEVAQHIGEIDAPFGPEYGMQVSGHDDKGIELRPLVFTEIGKTVRNDQAIGIVRKHGQPIHDRARDKVCVMGVGEDTVTTRHGLGFSFDVHTDEQPRGVGTFSVLAQQLDCCALGWAMLAQQLHCCAPASGSVTAGRTIVVMLAQQLCCCAPASGSATAGRTKHQSCSIPKNLRMRLSSAA